MDAEVAELILRDLTVIQFVVFLIFGMVGLMGSFLYYVSIAIKHDSNTDQKFNWRHFMKGVARTILAIIALIMCIIEWDKVSPIILESDGPVELTIWSSFLLGVSSDGTVEMLFGGGRKASKAMKKVRPLVWFVFLTIIFSL